MTQSVQNIVGKAVWEQHFGTVGDEPKAPREIPEDEIMVFIPATIEGKPLTLNHFLTLTPLCRKLGPSVKRSFGESSVGVSHWIRIQRTPQASADKTPPKEYHLPSLLDTVIAVVMWYLVTGEPLFKFSVKCHPGNPSQVLTVGNFDERGFEVVYRNRGDTSTMLFVHTVWAKRC